MKSKGKDRQVFRINRNILECKVILSNNRFGAARVLIETYWNVKIFISTKTIFEKYQY